LHNITYRRLHHNYVTVFKEYINNKNAFANYFLSWFYGAHLLKISLLLINI